jgi:hypothetical protein
MSKMEDHITDSDELHFDEIEVDERREEEERQRAVDDLIAVLEDIARGPKGI